MGFKENCAHSSQDSFNLLNSPAVVLPHIAIQEQTVSLQNEQ